MTLLEVTDLRTRYGSIEALKGISLTVADCMPMAAAVPVGGPTPEGMS